MSAMSSQGLSPQEVASKALALLSDSDSDQAEQGRQGADAPLDRFVRELLGDGMQLAHRLSLVARRPELRAIVSDRTGLCVAFALGREAMKLKHIAAELANKNAPDCKNSALENRAQVEEVLNTIVADANVVEVTMPPVRREGKPVNVEAMRAATTTLNTATQHLRDKIDRLRTLCGIAPGPESIGLLLVLLREIHTDARWARELDEESLGEQPLLREFKAHIEKCAAAIQEIHRLQQRYGPYPHTPEWEAFVHSYALVCSSAWALAEWSAFRADRKGRITHTRKVNAIGGLRECLTSVNMLIKRLGQRVGIHHIEQLGLDQGQPLSGSSTTAEQASVAKGALSFGRWAGMSERRANMYGLL